MKNLGGMVLSWRHALLRPRASLLRALTGTVLLTACLWGADLPIDMLIDRDISPSAVARGGSEAFTMAAAALKPSAVKNTLEVSAMFLPDGVSAQELGWLTVISKKPWHFSLLHFSSDAPVTSGSGEQMGDLNLRFVRLGAGTGVRLANSPIVLGGDIRLLNQRTYIYEHNYLSFDGSLIWSPTNVPLRFAFNLRNLGIDLFQIVRLFNPLTNQVIGSTTNSNMYVGTLPLTFSVATGFGLDKLMAEVALDYSPLPFSMNWSGGEFQARAGVSFTPIPWLTLMAGWRTRGTADSVVSGGLSWVFKLGDLPMNWRYAIEINPGFDPTHFVGLSIKFL